MGSRIYEILQPGQQPLANVTAEPVVIFASASALEAAVSAGRLPTGTSGVLYDPEAWPFTPVAEQQIPFRQPPEPRKLLTLMGYASLSPRA